MSHLVPPRRRCGDVGCVEEEERRGGIPSRTWGLRVGGESARTHKVRSATALRELTLLPHARLGFSSVGALTDELVTIARNVVQLGAERHLAVWWRTLGPTRPMTLGDMSVDFQ